MACQGCEGRNESDNQQLQIALKEAIKYAKEKNTAVGIYKDGQGKYQFIEYSLAAGLPIMQVVSQYSSITTG